MLRKQLFQLLLDMLDRLDQWETYLAVWHQLRRHTAYTVTYHTAAMRPRAQPCVVRRDREHLYLHFLWLTSYRKELIERKLAAKRAGRRLGHLRHHPPDELSDAEVRCRVADVARWARALRGEATHPPDADAPHGTAPTGTSTALVSRSSGTSSEAETPRVRAASASVTAGAPPAARSERMRPVRRTGSPTSMHSWGPRHGGAPSDRDRTRRQRLKQQCRRALDDARLASRRTSPIVRWWRFGGPGSMVVWEPRSAAY